MVIDLVEALAGNKTAASVLLYMQSYGEGYASAIARTYGTAINPVLQQLERLEQRGVLVQRLYGRTRVYTWNFRYPLRRELQVLLERALELASEREKEAYFMERRRPRLRGKDYELDETEY